MMKKRPIAEYNDPCSIPIWQSGIAGSHLPCVICLVFYKATRNISVGKECYYANSCEYNFDCLYEREEIM